MPCTKITTIIVLQMLAESDEKSNTCWMFTIVYCYLLLFCFTEKQREGERDVAEKEKGISRYM